MSDDGGGGIAFLTRRGIPPAMQQLVLTFGIVAIVGVGYGVYKVGEYIRVLRGGYSDAAHSIKKWGRDPALGLDVNGDGTEDVVGQYLGRDPFGNYLGAFDGKTGKLLWRAGPFNVISGSAAGAFPEFGWQGKLALVNERTQAHVIQLADGKEVGRLALPNARVVCSGPSHDAPLVVDVTSSKTSYQVDLTSASSTPVPETQRCNRNTANAHFVDEARFTAAAKLWFVLESGAAVVGLTKNDDKTQSVVGYGSDRSKPSYTVPIPDGGITQPSGTLMDIAKGRVFVCYSVKGKPKVMALDAKTGKQLWNVPVEADIQTKGLSAGEQRVYLAVSDYLEVRDAATGKLLLGFGEGE